jgi:predicted nucleotidyltransferase
MSYSRTDYFLDLKLTNPPVKWMKSTSIYECYTGSQAYGIANANSDWDIYSIVVPPKDVVFPHLSGYIHRFHKDIPKFVSHQNRDGSKIVDPKDKREYDLQVYSIIEFFRSAADNNPNIIDALFVPHNCVLYSKEAGNHLRENRKIFLNKIALWKFIGYAHSQKKLMTQKTEESKRYSDQLEYGMDRKAASHTVRLLNECWQILATGDLDLTANTEMLKEIRRGEWSKERVFKYVEDQEPLLKKLYQDKDVVPYEANMEAITKLLLECLEISYGTLYCASCVLNYENNTKHKEAEMIRNIKNILNS